MTYEACVCYCCYFSLVGSLCLSIDFESVCFIKMTWLEWLAKSAAKRNETSTNSKPQTIAGAKSWKIKNRKAYGIAMSLYDQHPISGKISGLSMSFSPTLLLRLKDSMLNRA